MLEHKTRLWLIGAAFALVVIALVALGALDALSGELLAGLLGALGVLTPAILDAGAEQRKRSRSIAPPPATDDAQAPDSGDDS